MLVVWLCPILSGWRILTMWAMEDWRGSMRKWQTTIFLVSAGYSWYNGGGGVYTGLWQSAMMYMYELLGMQELTWRVYGAFHSGTAHTSKIIHATHIYILYLHLYCSKIASELYTMYLAWGNHVCEASTVLLYTYMCTVDLYTPLSLSMLVSFAACNVHVTKCTQTVSYFSVGYLWHLRGTDSYMYMTSLIGCMYTCNVYMISNKKA